MVVAENVRCSYKVNMQSPYNPEYFIFNCWDSDDLWMYSIEKNELCKLEISGYSFSKSNYMSISPIFSNDGKKLTVLVWVKNKSKIATSV